MTRDAPCETVLVVPCFNEADRLRVEEFRSCVTRDEGIAFLFVNDGSGDQTGPILERLCRDQPLLRHVDLPRNQGKAEAVRQGVRAAWDWCGKYVGYWDADLATPLDQIGRFVAHLEASPTTDIVMGARVKLLGRNIRRSELRHYLGRVVATLASIVTGLPVYDTQCGAKLFRKSERIRPIFDEPFSSRWMFDVEIILRYLARVELDPNEISAGATTQICEIPLDQWHDIGGSKVKPMDFPKALYELLRLWNARQRRSGRR